MSTCSIPGRIRGSESGILCLRCHQPTSSQIGDTARAPIFRTAYQTRFGSVGQDDNGSNFDKIHTRPPVATRIRLDSAARPKFSSRNKQEGLSSIALWFCDHISTFPSWKESICTIPLTVVANWTCRTQQSCSVCIGFRFPTPRFELKE